MIEIPKLRTTEQELAWLNAIYEKLLSGEAVNPIELRIKLRNILDEKFDPYNIDRRLLSERGKITLLGIYFLDKDSEIIKNTDTIIKFIKGQIIENPTITEITAVDILEKTGIPLNQTKVVFDYFDGLGNFWRSKGARSIDGKTVSNVGIDDYNVISEYLNYQNIETLITKYFERLNRNLKDEEEDKEIHELTRIENDSLTTNKVFVVHGRNDKLRRDFFSFLRSVKIEPIEWSEAIRLTKKTSPYIGEVLDTAFNYAQAIIVLLSPDDEVRLKKEFHNNNEPISETNVMGQARPNVLFEAGMAIGRNQNRTIIIEVGNVKPFSDIAGRHVIRLNNSAEKRKEVISRLKTAKCPVSDDGHDWQSIGDFNFLDTTKKPSNSKSKPQIKSKIKNRTPTQDILSAKYSGIIPTIKNLFNVDIPEWARIIYQLGSSKLEWTTQKTLLSKTLIPVYHISQLLINKPEIVETKKWKKEIYFKLTPNAKRQFETLEKELNKFNFQSISNENKFIVEDWEVSTNKTTPQWTTYKEINLNGKSLRSISSTITIQSEYLRFGFKLLDMNAQVFEIGGIVTSDNSFLIHIGKESNADVLISTYYNINNRGNLTPHPGKFSIGSKVTIEIKISEDNTLHFYTNGYKVYIIDSINPEVRKRVCVMSWGDGNEYSHRISNTIITTI